MYSSHLSLSLSLSTSFFHILQYKILSFRSPILKLFFCSILMHNKLRTNRSACHEYKHIANIGISIDKQAAHAVAAATTTSASNTITALFFMCSVLIRNSCKLIYNVKVCWKNIKFSMRSI